MNIGNKVTAFFTQQLQLHITTTAIRSLVETTVDMAVKEGKVTEQQQKSVQSINGHTSQIARDYYIRQDRAQDVHLARIALAQATSSALPHGLPLLRPPAVAQPFHPALSSEVSVRDDEPVATNMEASAPTASPLVPAFVNGAGSATWRTADLLQYADWGTNHPDYRTKQNRAQWTKEEVNYIRVFCEREIREKPNNRNNMCARCLRHIKSDKAALPIFHAGHVLDSPRLRVGYDLACKLMKESVY